MIEACFSGGVIQCIVFLSSNCGYFTMYLVLFRLPILSKRFSSIPFFKSLLAVADDKFLNTFM